MARFHALVSTGFAVAAITGSPQLVLPLIFGALAERYSFGAGFGMIAAGLVVALMIIAALGRGRTIAALSRSP